MTTESHLVTTSLQSLLPLHPGTIDLIGSAAAVLTTGSFVPQAWLTFRSRDVSGISTGMYSAFTLGVALWLVYGVAMGSWPITIANSITVSLALAILSMKLYFGRNQN